MPGMDGWAVLTTLKSDAVTAEIPVIMVTIVDDRSLGFALGAADYLVKPIDRNRLVTVLERFSARKTAGSSRSLRTSRFISSRTAQARSATPAPSRSSAARSWKRAAGL